MCMLSAMHDCSLIGDTHSLCIDKSHGSRKGAEIVLQAQATKELANNIAYCFTERRSRSCARLEEPSKLVIIFHNGIAHRSLVMHRHLAATHESPLGQLCRAQHVRNMAGSAQNMQHGRLLQQGPAICQAALHCQTNVHNWMASSAR